MKKTRTVVELHTKEQSKESAVEESKVGLSLLVPAELYERLKLESLMQRRSIGSLVEEWAEQNTSTDDVVISADTLARQRPVSEKSDSSMEMRTVSTPISRRHHDMIRLEAFRQGIPIRTLVRGWIENNTRQWHVEGGNPKEVPASPGTAVI